MSPEDSKRKRLPWPWWRRLWREPVWGLDLDDGTGDGSPSLTKILALGTALVGFVAILRQLDVSGNHILLITIAISAAFGRGVWKLWISRGSWSAATTTTTSKSEQLIRQEISDRRKQGDEDGTEPA